jgi:hypothetical protein
MVIAGIARAVKPVGRRTKEATMKRLFLILAILFLFPVLSFALSPVMLSGTAAAAGCSNIGYQTIGSTAANESVSTGYPPFGAIVISGTGCKITKIEVSIYAHGDDTVDTKIALYDNAATWNRLHAGCTVDNLTVDGWLSCDISATPVSVNNGDTVNVGINVSASALLYIERSAGDGTGHYLNGVAYAAFPEATATPADWSNKTPYVRVYLDN